MAQELPLQSERGVDMLMSKQREMVKREDSIFWGHIIRLYPDYDYGFLEAENGDLIHFTRFCVVGNLFDKLKIGTKVYFELMSQIKGLQATNVVIALHQ